MAGGCEFSACFERSVVGSAGVPARTEKGRARHKCTDWHPSHGELSLLHKRCCWRDARTTVCGRGRPRSRLACFRFHAKRGTFAHPGHQPIAFEALSDLDRLLTVLYSSVQKGVFMKTVSFTEFRNNASGFVTAAERGESVVVIRHGREVAVLGPAGAINTPSWKMPALRLSVKGAGLSTAILEERDREIVS